MNLYEKILNKAPLQCKTRGHEVVFLNIEQIGHMVYGDTETGWQCSINLLNESFDCLCPAFWNQRNKKDYVAIPEVEKYPCKHLCGLCEKMLEK